MTTTQVADGYRTCQDGNESPHGIRDAKVMEGEEEPHADQRGDGRLGQASNFIDSQIE